MTGNAAIQAAERARDVIALHAGKKLDAPLERVTFAAGRVFDVQDPERGLTFAEAEVTRSSGASRDRKSTRLNSSHSQISYAVFCLKKTNIDANVCFDRFPVKNAGGSRNNLPKPKRVSGSADEFTWVFNTKPDESGSPELDRLRMPV